MKKPELGMTSFGLNLAIDHKVWEMTIQLDQSIEDIKDVTISKVGLKRMVFEHLTR